MKGRGRNREAGVRFVREYPSKTGRYVEVLKKVVQEPLASALGVTVIFLERFKERQLECKTSGFILCFLFCYY